MIEQSLSLNQKIGQLFFIGISGPEVDERTRELLTEISPGGVCLFTRNIREAAQTRRLLDEIRTVSELTPLLSIDQEGGPVDRLRRVMIPMPAAGKLRTSDHAAKLAEIIAEALQILGFNMDFAPVVDVIDERRGKYSNGLFSRTFGSSKEEVADLADAFLASLQQSGIVGCIKHFPGLGASTVDSHEELPQVDIIGDELFATDLFPYFALLRNRSVKAIMIAHASFPRVRLQEKDQNGKLLPSSLSKNFITTLLRDKLGFGGLVITDDLEMGAIVKNYGIGEACKMALNAGVDMLAICADPVRIREGYLSVLRAVETGELSEERIDLSLGRVSELKGQLTRPAAFDREKLSQLSDRVATLSEALGQA